MSLYYRLHGLPCVFCGRAVSRIDVNERGVRTVHEPGHNPRWCESVRTNSQAPNRRGRVLLSSRASRAGSATASEGDMTDTPVYHDVLQWILRGRANDTPVWPAEDPDARDGPTEPRSTMSAEMFLDWPEVEHIPGKGDSLFRAAMVAPAGEWSGCAA